MSDKAHRLWRIKTHMSRIAAIIPIDKACWRIRRVKEEAIDKQNTMRLEHRPKALKLAEGIKKMLSHFRAKDKVVLMIQKQLIFLKEWVIKMNIIESRLF